MQFLFNILSSADTFLEGDEMNFYIKLIIKILEKSMTGQDSEILYKLKKGIDLNSEDRKNLEEIIDNL